MQRLACDISSLIRRQIGDSGCDITLTDLTVLVNSLFVTFEPTASLSDFDNCACGG